MSTAESTLYIANPDVSCREEGDEGALLFNPDTDQVLVVNSTGLLIWQALQQPHNQEEVIAALSQECNNIPAGQVQQDVAQFIERLQASGFIGIFQGAIP